MSWVGFRIRFATAFSYRWPDVAGLALPLPGPSAVRLSLVGAARERAKALSPVDERRAAEEILAAIRDAPLFLEPPERVVLWTATMRRLAAQSGPSAGIRRDALPREHASPSGPYTVWFDLPDGDARQRVLEVLPWLRSLGTRESLCRSEPMEPGAAPQGELAAGEVPRDSEPPSGGVAIEVREVAPDATLDRIEDRGAYRPALWALPGAFRPLDERARVFERGSWPGRPSPSWPWRDAR